MEKERKDDTDTFEGKKDKKERCGQIRARVHVWGCLWTCTDVIQEEK